MKVRYFGAKDRSGWNAFAAGWPAFGLLQSYEWGEFKESLGWTALRLAIERDGAPVAGAQMLVKPFPLRLGSMAYIPRGPLVDWQDGSAVRALLAGIHQAARERGAVFLKIEPAVRHTPDAIRRLQALDFLRSRHSNQPQATVIVDLTADLDTILARMRKSTRRNIRRSQRDGVGVREGDENDLPAYYRLLRQTSARAGFPLRSFDYYRQEWSALARVGSAKLLLAVYRDQVVAASLEAAFGDRAASLHSGSLADYHHLKANDRLVWEFMQWAKANGCKSYDLWGVPDEIAEMLARGEAIPEGKTGGLWGVYDFKRGFGAVPVSYVGAFDFVYARRRHRLLEAMMTGLGSIDRLAQMGDRLRV